MQISRKLLRGIPAFLWDLAGLLWKKFRTCDKPAGIYPTEELKVYPEILHHFPENGSPGLGKSGLYLLPILN